jgi:tyrosine-protein phosphatase YwqE
VFGWFKKKAPVNIQPLTVDIHSHLLSALDDGVQKLEDAEDIILQFQALGYRKLITTPHVMSDMYRNTNEGIRHALEALQQHLHSKNIDITIECAAEYYLDEDLMRKVLHNEPLLTFGHNYLLFETNFLNEPLYLKEFIFQASSKGYKLVLAHPERYLYLQSNFSKVQDILDRGVLFQLNISSITGYYSRAAQTAAQKLIDSKYVHFLGSDCHHLQHVKLVEKAQKMNYFQKALSLPLLNHTL